MIRRAKEQDAERICYLYRQIQAENASVRSDIFRSDVEIVPDRILRQLLSVDQPQILVWEDGDGTVQGYINYDIRETRGSSLLTDRKTFYIGDFCVEHDHRGQGIGTALYRYAQDLAKRLGCHSISLNIWHTNLDSVDFYIKMGMEPLKTTMEQTL